jgi:hypothetical protein
MHMQQIIGVMWVAVANVQHRAERAFLYLEWHIISSRLKGEEVMHV